MPLAALQNSVRKRIRAYQRSGDRHVLLSDEVRAEADALFEAAATQGALDAAEPLLGELFLLRFGCVPAPTGGIADLARAVMHLWTATGPGVEVGDVLRTVLPGPGADAAMQFGAAVLIVRHAVDSGDWIALTAAQLLFNALVESSTPRNPAHAVYLAFLAQNTWEFYERTNDPTYRERAIDVYLHADATLPEGAPERGWFLGFAAYAVLEPLSTSANFTALGPGITLGEKALRYRTRKVLFRRTTKTWARHPYTRLFFDAAVTARLSPHQPFLFAALCAAYRQRCAITRTPQDADRAVAMAKRIPRAYGLTALCGRASAYLTRFDNTGRARDFRRAARFGAQVVALAGDDDDDRQAVREYAAIATMAGFKPSMRAMAACPPPPPHAGGYLRRLWLANFAALALRGFALDTLITFGELAIAGPLMKFDESISGLFWTDDPVTDEVLVRLAACYHGRFVRTSDRADIERAVALAGFTSWAQDPDKIPDPFSAAEVGAIYRSRFTQSRARDDLTDAIQLFQWALDRLAPDHPERTGIVLKTAEALRAAYAVFGSAEALRQAVSLLEDGIEVYPHQESEGLYAGADTYRLLFQESAELAHLDHAIELCRQAVAAGDDANERAGLTAHLGSMYHLRYNATGDVADLRRSVEIHRETLQTARRAQLVAQLCRAEHELLRHTGRPADPGLAAQFVDLATAPTNDAPADRVDACQAAGKLAMALDLPQLAVRAFDHAVGLLRVVADRDLEWAEQQQVLSGYGALAGETVAAHLAAGDTAGAVDAAERGRALILGSELDIRADFADLAAAQPHLATRLREIHDRLNTPVQRSLTGEPIPDQVGRRNRAALWAEHDELARMVQGLPGFEHFMAPRPLSDLRQATEGGAVVLVNAAGTRGDAVILTADAEAVHVALPRFTAAAVRTHRDAIRAIEPTSLTGTLRSQRVLSEVLAWLWESVVDKVRVELRQQRVWWLPIGTVGALPLHAAGIAGEPGALDLLVSSYIPSLRALHHLRRRPVPTARHQLTVALADTPGFPRLPGTTAEAAVLQAQHPDHPLLTGAEAHATNVLAALQNSTWAHFGCHATAVAHRAVLHLHHDELHVHEIGRVRTAGAELAYLSACSTAFRGEHADEPLTLASAFHLAGFRHVVASLWPLNDHAGAAASQTFYRELPDTPSAERAAHAVRAAARTLRDTYPERPDLWAALVHSGP